MQACLPVLPSSREGPHPQAQPPTAFYVHSPAPISADESTRQSKELKLEKMENGERRSFAFSILVSQYHNFPPCFTPLQTTCHTCTSEQPKLFWRPLCNTAVKCTGQFYPVLQYTQAFESWRKEIVFLLCGRRGTSFTPKYTNHSKTVYTRCTL